MRNSNSSRVYAQTPYAISTYGPESEINVIHLIFWIATQPPINRRIYATPYFPSVNRQKSSHADIRDQLQYRKIAKISDICARFKSLTSIKQANIRILIKCSSATSWRVIRFGVMSSIREEMFSDRLIIVID